MVFLFPGVLFRKFYFTGNFGNQFGQGNLLERFLWSIFLSFICLTSVSIILYSLDALFGIKPLEAINFNRLSCVFQSLSENKFPGEFQNKTNFISYLFLLLFIYVISSTLGYASNKFLLLFSLENFAAFKFNNNWHYLSKAYKSNDVRKNIGDVHLTYVDVLTTINSNEILYRGILNNFILDKEDKLENIVLSKVYRFITLDRLADVFKINAIEDSIQQNENIYSVHRESNERIIFTKSIDGNLLVLSKENISNINFTYVKISNRITFLKEIVLKILGTLFVCLILILFILPFLKFNNDFLNTLLRKLVFSFVTFLCMSLIIGKVSQVIKSKNLSPKDKIDNLDFIFILCLFSTPYLWVFNITSFFYASFAALLVLIVFVYISIKKTKK